MSTFASYCSHIKGNCNFTASTLTFISTHTHTHTLPGGSELPLFGPSTHMLISINHPTKQMSGTKERSPSPALWGKKEGGDGRMEEGGGKKQEAGKASGFRFV